MKGGKREGAGRPRLYPERMKNTSVHLTPEQREKALRIGKGDLAMGVRLTIEAYDE